ncbi:MAG: hypothetical protein AAF547_05350 [Actinomycetota bacterium]
MFPVAPPVEGRDWLTSDPIDWSTLRGRVVVAVFWSFACEASLVALRELSLAAAAWRDPEIGVGDRDDQPVVLAVHTPRFPFEDDVDRVGDAVARHRIDHLVVHDPDYLTWNRYNPEGWPATAVIGRNGRVVGMAAGSGVIEAVSQAVATELARPAGRRHRDRVAIPRPRPAQAARADDATLRFPAGLAVTPGGRLVVADTGNDRLLIGTIDSDNRTMRPSIEITDIDRPTAVAAGAETVLHVIESGTGSVLQVDLEAGALDVLADDELLAPTALAIDRDGSLVVADAGNDQLVRIAADDGDPGDLLGTTTVTIGPIAGSGLSGCRDGAAGQARLAQPVDLVRTDGGIAFCDAASSNIRLLTDGGSVVTATGNGFYDWGLVDGPVHRARFQRPSGLCVGPDGALIIADTGNGRLRRLADRRVTTLGLSGLEQPTAIDRLPTGHLIIADTGNHRIVVADPAARSGWPLAVYPATMTSIWEPTTEVG